MNATNGESHALNGANAQDATIVAVIKNIIIMMKMIQHPVTLTIKEAIKNQNNDQ